MNGRARFGLFEFDAAEGELTREGVPVRLQPQPARVLAILVAHAGEVVTREALRQEVWNDGTFVDFERGLNFCIAQIRSALGDAADSPRFIETLPRRGYRFIAPVTSMQQRLRPERGAESPRESERGWGPASIEKSLPNASKPARTWNSHPQALACRWLPRSSDSRS